MERRGATFDHEPDGREKVDALSEADRLIARDAGYAHSEFMASITVGDLGWNAMRARSAWTDDLSCRHTRDSENLVVLHIYG